MMVLYILLALLAFGVMIFFHELGHFAFAKLFKFSIKEFSIGMGPKLFSKKAKDGVQYSIRLLPVGGFVSMEGESEDSDDPDAFNKKPAYQRFLVVIAGALMNVIIAVLIVFILTVSSPYFGTTVIGAFDNDKDIYMGLQIDDRIVKIDNKSVRTYDELSYEIMMNGYEPINVEVVRDGKRITVRDVSFPVLEEDGIKYGVMNFKVRAEERSFVSVIKNTFYTSVSTVKMIKDSIIGLITGRFGIKQISGPVGVTGAMVEVAKYGTRSFLYLVAVISMNLGIFNLLPIPALDGGTLFLTSIEIFFRKKLPRKIEDVSKLIGFGALIALMIFVSIKDIFSLIF